MAPDPTVSLDSPCAPSSSLRASFTRRHWLVYISAVFSAIVPLATAIMHAAQGPQWRDDLAFARAVGLSFGVGEGTLSTLLLVGTRLLPVGSQHFRGALGSAAALGFVGWLLFENTLCILKIAAGTRRSAPLFALAAALMATLSTWLQYEGTVAGGTTVSVALVLGGLLLLVDPSAQKHPYRWFSLGLITSLCALESLAATGVLLAAIATQIPLWIQNPPGILEKKCCVLGALLPLGWLLVALGIRRLLPAIPFLPSALLTSASVVSWGSLHQAKGEINAWAESLGWAPVLLAVCGLSMGAAARFRWSLMPAAMVSFAALVLPSGGLSPFALEAPTPIRALALCAIAMLSLFAGEALLRKTLSANLPLVRPAAVFFLVCMVALEGATLEDALPRADRTDAQGATLWTDETLSRLPPFALILVQSIPQARRLWVARHLTGQRPDVLTIALPLLHESKAAALLLQEENNLAPLLRDIANQGEPSEYSLSALADTRPLFVELGSAWTHALASHVAPDWLWLRFTAEPLGASDRQLGRTREVGAFARIANAARGNDTLSSSDHKPDEATLEMLTLHLRERITVAHLCNDSNETTQASEQLQALERTAPVIANTELLRPGEASSQLLTGTKKRRATRRDLKGYLTEK